MSNIKLPRYVDLKLDAGFKAVFVDKNNRELLRKMLNLLLPERDAIAEIEAYLDREQLPDFQGGKGTALDVLCCTDDGRRFIVEMQQRQGRALPYDTAREGVGRAARRADRPQPPSTFPKNLVRDLPYTARLCQCGPKRSKAWRSSISRSSGWAMPMSSLALSCRLLP